MGGKIVLNLAMSLDGYIADENGMFDWIQGHSDRTLDTKNKYDFNEFLQSIDVVVMGRKCYDQDLHTFSKIGMDKVIYVATSKPLENYGNIIFVEDDITKVIKDEKQNGKKIYLYGGGVLIDHFIKEDLIDEYLVGIIPTILGDGKKLFYDNNPKIDLKLEKSIIDDGVVIMRYSKRAKK